MNYAKLRKYDVSNWSGINSTIFFSGCNLIVPNCFNKEAQNLIMVDLIQKRLRIYLYHT